MTMPNPVSSAGTTRKRPLNEFLFIIVNNFTLDEFKKFTNFPELMQEVILRTVGPEPQRVTLADRIRHNFKRNVPDESKWRRGGFNELQLKPDFYGSDVARRIFEKVYGLRECAVRPELPAEYRKSEEPTKSIQLSSDEEEDVRPELPAEYRKSEEPTKSIQLSSDEEEDVIAKIDLVESDEPSSIDNSKIPQRRIKYPRKRIQLDKSKSMSGIDHYASTRKFVEQVVPSLHGFNDEIPISTFEPPTASSAHVEVISNVLIPPTAFPLFQPVTTASKRVEVISNVLAPPTPFRDETNQQRNPATNSLQNRTLKPKIGPKSKVQQRRVVYIDEDSEGLPEPAKETLNNLPKPKIGPKSRMKQLQNSPLDTHLKTTQDLLHDLMYIDPPPPTTPIIESSAKPSEAPVANPPERYEEHSPKVGIPRMRPCIGPASIMANRKNLQSSAKESSEKSQLTGLSIEPPITKSTNIDVAKPKPKIGPKSRMKQLRNSSVDSNVNSTQGLLNDLMFTDPSTIIVTINEPTAEPSQTFDQPEVLRETSPKASSSIKFRIGPQSMPNLQKLQLSPQKLPVKSIHTGPPVKLSNIDFSQPDPKIVSQAPITSSTRIDEGGVFGPISPANLSSQSDRSSRHLLTKPHSSSKQHKKSIPPSQIKAVATENMEAAEGSYHPPTPCQTCHVQETNPSNQLHGGLLGSDSPTECCDLSEFDKSWLESMQRARQHFTKYRSEMDPNVQSVKHFWNDFLKSEFGEDSSASETILIANPNDNNELEAQSQAILHPDQIDADNFDEIQMGQLNQLQAENVDEVRMEQSHPLEMENLDEPQSSHVDQLEMENVNEMPMELHSPVAVPYMVQIAEHSDVETGTKIKIEVIDQDINETYSEVQIIEIPPDEPIEILLDDTEELYAGLQVDRNDTEKQLLMPIDKCQQITPAASSSKGFMTSLPVIPSKKQNYQPLDIVVEAVPKIKHVEFPAFSQQHLTPPSNENYQIEECTMTESQHQRYDLLNQENTLFLSSQLENYAFNTGKTPNPKSDVTLPDRTTQPLALKRLSQEVMHRQPYKRRRCNEPIKLETNWKIIDIKSITFKPLANYTFHLELQLHNNYETFHVQDQPSVKRILHLSNNEWKQVGRVLTALNGYRYDSSASAIATQNLDLPSRVMNCFVQSIPLFVRSNIQFKDFMGHCLEVSEQQPLRDECVVDGAIDPDIFRKMGELKKQLDSTEN